MRREAFIEKGRAAMNRAFGSLPCQTAPLPCSRFAIHRNSFEPTADYVVRVLIGDSLLFSTVLIVIAAAPLTSNGRKALPPLKAALAKAQE
jgi:hypothetical protein